MYSVIVVDDESEIREGIINRVPWTELGFEVIGDAENGVEALDLVETLQPDVVMSDIKIPFMDGLTLAEKIRETSLSTKVIIFSGFDDFDYAKRAIRLNVVEYIMKPISASELSQTLRKLKKDLDEEREARRNLERMRSLFDTSLPVLREQFLQKLLTGSATEEQLTAQADLLQMDLTVSAKSPLYVVYFGQIESSAEPNPLEFFSLQQTVEETLTAHAKVQSFVRGGSLLVFVTLNPQEDDLTLIRDLNSVCSYAHVVLLMEVGAGVSTPITSLASVAKAYEEAFTAYTHSRENGKPQALSFTDVSPANARPFPISSEAWRDFSQAISLKTPEQLNVVIDDLFRNLRRLTWNKRQLEELSLEFLTHFLQMIRNYDIETDRIVDPSNTLMSQVLELRTLDEIENWVRYISQAIAQEISRIRQSSVERFADEAKAYVASHFRDPNLSVDVICRELHVSPAYFSTIFKRQTGQAFSAYLTEVRLNEALRLLETTNDKTYLITEKVGYSDPNYFSYAFKKQFGISPTQYRKRLTEGSERPETLSQTGDGFTSGAGLADGGTLQ